jgi:hypothetical protein
LQDLALIRTSLIAQRNPGTKFWHMLLIPPDPGKRKISRRRTQCNFRKPASFFFLIKFSRETASRHLDSATFFELLWAASL